MEEHAIEDPANPSGNDLTPLLDQVRQPLSMVATTTLALIEDEGWESVFGPVDDEKDDESRAAEFSAAAVHVSNPTKPWLPDA